MNVYENAIRWPNITKDGHLHEMIHITASSKAMITKNMSAILRLCGPSGKDTMGGGTTLYNNLLVTRRLCASIMSLLYSSIGIPSFLPRKFTVRLYTSTVKDRNEMENDKVCAIVRRIRRVQRCDHLSPISTPYQPSSVNY
jgi:hypothetical protein